MVVQVQLLLAAGGVVPRKGTAVAVAVVDVVAVAAEVVKAGMRESAADVALEIDMERFPMNSDPAST